MCSLQRGCPFSQRFQNVLLLWELDTFGTLSFMIESCVLVSFSRGSTAVLRNFSARIVGEISLCPNGWTWHSIGATKCTFCLEFIVYQFVWMLRMGLLDSAVCASPGGQVRGVRATSMTALQTHAPIMPPVRYQPQQLFFPLT